VKDERGTLHTTYWQKRCVLWEKKGVRKVDNEEEVAEELVVR